MGFYPISGRLMSPKGADELPAGSMAVAAFSRDPILAGAPTTMNGVKT